MDLVKASLHVLHPAILATLESLESRLLLSVSATPAAAADPAAAYQATQLAFIGLPGSASTAKQPIGPAIVVDVEDAAGDIVSTDNSVVSLRLTTGAFSNHQSSLIAAAIDGVATFNNVVIKKNGVHALEATDGNLLAATEGGFWVGPLAIDGKSALPLSTITLSGPALNSSEEYKIDFTSHGSTVQSPLVSISPIQVLAPIPLNSKKTAIAVSTFRLSLQEPGGGTLPITGSLSVKAFGKDPSLGAATIEYLQSVQADLATAATAASGVASDSTGSALAQLQLAQISGVIAGEIQSIQNLVAGGSAPVIVSRDTGEQILLSRSSLQLTDQMFAELSASESSADATDAMNPNDAWAQSAEAMMESARQAEGAAAQGIGLIDSYDLSPGQPPAAAAQNTYAAGAFFAFNTIPLAYSTLVDAGAAYINPPAGEGIAVLRQYGFADTVNYFGELSASFLYNVYGGSTLTDVSAGKNDAAAAAADAFADLGEKGGIGREILEAADTGDATDVAFYATSATSDGLLAQYQPLPEPGVTPSPPPTTPPTSPIAPNPPPTIPVSPGPPPHTPSPPPHAPSPPPYTPSPPPTTPTPPPYTPTPPPYTPSPPPSTPTPPPYTPSPPPSTPTPPPYTPSPPPSTPTPPPYTPSPPPYAPTPPPYTPTPPPYTYFVRAGTATGQTDAAAKVPAGKSGDSPNAQSPSPTAANQPSSPADLASASPEPFVTTDAPNSLDNTTYNTDSADDTDEDPAAKFESSENHQDSTDDPSASSQAEKSTGTADAQADSSAKPGASSSSSSSSSSTTSATSPTTSTAPDESTGLSAAQGSDANSSQAAAGQHTMEQDTADRGFKPRWTQTDLASDPTAIPLHPRSNASAFDRQKPSASTEKVLFENKPDPADKPMGAQDETVTTAIPQLSAAPVAPMPPAVAPVLDAPATPIHLDAAKGQATMKTAGVRMHAASGLAGRASHETADIAKAADAISSVAKPHLPKENLIDAP